MSYFLQAVPVFLCFPPGVSCFLLDFFSSSFLKDKSALKFSIKYQTKLPFIFVEFLDDISYQH